MSDEHHVHERVRRFNEDETVWRRFAEKSARRRSTPDKPREELLDQLDWLAAERKCRDNRVVGRDA